MSATHNPDDDLAIITGSLIGVLFYTCAVLGCVKVYQCRWLINEYDDYDATDDDAPTLRGPLLEENGGDDDEEADVVACRRRREAVVMAGPQDV
jgi:hypothetical protein